jgi:N4-gp56 family major capsid protein
VFLAMGERRTLESGSHTYVFSLMDASTKTLAQATIQEGITPVTTALSSRQVSVSMTQLGDYATLTDLAVKDNPFPLVEAAAYEISRIMAQNADILVQNVLNTGTNTIIRTVAGVTTFRASLVAADIIKPKYLAEAFTRLQSAAAPTYDMDYVAVVHPKVVNDLLTDTATDGFIELAKYQASTKIFNAEIGKLYGVRIVVGNNIQPFAGAGTGPIDVYPTYVFGSNAYGVVESQSMETVIQPFGSEGSADPLRQRMTVGLKMRFGAALLKTESLWRIESSVSIA